MSQLHLVLKFNNFSGPDYDTELGCQHITVRMLMEEVHTKACEAREWALVRLTAGLLKKQLEELSKAVTHLLVRQKQITVCFFPVASAKTYVFRWEWLRKKKKSSLAQKPTKNLKR